MTWLRFKIAVKLIDLALWLMPEVVEGGDDVYGRIVRPPGATELTRALRAEYLA